MGREATVREVEVEKMLKCHGCLVCQDMLLPGKVTKSEVKERTQEQVEGFPIGQWRVQ